MTPTRGLLIVPLLAAVLVAVGLAGPASAQDEGPGPPPDPIAGCTWTLQRGVSGLEEWAISCEETHPPAGSGPGVPSTGTPQEWLYWVQVQGPCWRIAAALPEDVDPLNFYAHGSVTLAVQHYLAHRDLYGGTPDLERCPSDPFIAESPQQAAIRHWTSVTSTLAPTLTTSPPDGRAVPGLPVFVMIDPYQPTGDVDTSPHTITWDFGAIELRGTATHLVDWGQVWADNEFVYPQGYVDTLGRPYEPGDEHGPLSYDDAGQPVYDGDTQPLAMIYQTDGPRTVSVTLRLEGEWNHNGGPWQPLPLPPLERSTTIDVDVVEYQAVITD